MNCFECATTDDTVAAVAICRHRGLGLCFADLTGATHFLVGCTREGCRHEIPRVKPLVDVPAGIAESPRHHVARAA